MILLQPPLLCEEWGGRPLCVSGDSSVLMYLRWPCNCTIQSSILPTGVDSSSFPLFHSNALLLLFSLSFSSISLQHRLQRLIESLQKMLLKKLISGCLMWCCSGSVQERLQIPIMLLLILVMDSSVIRDPHHLEKIL